MTQILTDSLLAFRSSGDLIADRRFAYAEALFVDGDHAAAADLLAQVLELVPRWPVAWFKLGEVEAARERREEAIAAFERTLILDPADAMGAALHLGRLGAPASPQHAPSAYVAGLFDQYAERFDTHLLEVLDYRGPALLLAAVQGLGMRTFVHAIDLGCGTGLAGLAFRTLARRLTGVDLSPGMVAVAREKHIYDWLEVANIEEFLVAQPAESADLLIAADVLCYVGDLHPIMRAAHTCLEVGGVFAATLQKGDQAFQVGADLRFAHAPSYIRAVAVACGLRVALLDEAAIRRDAGVDVAGLVVIFCRDS